MNLFITSIPIKKLIILDIFCRADHESALHFSLGSLFKRLKDTIGESISFFTILFLLIDDEDEDG